MADIEQVLQLDQEQQYYYEKYFGRNEKPGSDCQALADQSKVCQHQMGKEPSAVKAIQMRIPVDVSSLDSQLCQITGYVVRHLGKV